MRDLDECSGPWVGWWIQHKTRGHIRLTLNIGAGQMRGSGVDDVVGPFEIMGEYQGERVNFGKVHRTHIVEYGGRWNGASIAGLWRIRYMSWTDQGEFEMWPERESVTVEEILAMADEAIERRDPVPRGERTNGNRMVA